MREAVATVSNDLTTTCAMVFGLRPIEARALVELTKRNYVTREQLHVAMSRDGNPVSAIRGIGVVVCRLRKKLRAHDVKITTNCKVGYRLDEDSRDRVRAVLAGHGADIADAAAPPPPIPRGAKTVAA